ncbi:MAG: transglutaminase domain-containing protein [Anaerolineae bacterium]
MQQRWLATALIGTLILMIAVSTGSASTARPGEAPHLAATALCEQVYSGTIQSEFRICSTDPNTKIVGQGEVHLANYDLWVTTVQPAPCIAIFVASTLTLPADAAYPLQTGALPADAKQYLGPDYLIQSDNPAIQALAAQLASGKTREDSVVSSIVMWLNGHITISAGGSNDALGVLSSSSGSERGFVNLAAALLRAAGVPAQVSFGGVTADVVLGQSWTASSHGSYHYWILVYYPGLGWVPTDPQRTVNWVDTSHIAAPFYQLESTSVTITRISHQEDLSLVEQIRHSYTDTLVSGDLVYSAAGPESHEVLAWAQKSLVLAVQRSQPTATAAIVVESLRCDGAWKLSSSVPWLVPAIVSGSERTEVQLSIDVNALNIGFNLANLTLSTDSSAELPVVTATIPVVILVGDPLSFINIPLVH